MTTISNQIVDHLSDDMVSHGLLVQFVQQTEDRRSGPPLNWKEILRELLSDGVEIGTARKKTPDYVEFIAWRGSIDERIARAEKSVRDSSDFDKEFAYWLALRKNVDRYEGE